MIVYLDRSATKKDITKASEEFGDYIKIAIDIQKKAMAIGGRLHADSEKVLLERGSKQLKIWGGGFDLKNGRIDTQAVINIRPGQGNDSMEILDPEVRKIFIKITENFLK